MVSTTQEGVVKEGIDTDNSIIIIDTTLRTIIPPQIKKMSACYKVMCGCKCCISTKIMHSSLLSLRDSYFKKLKYTSQNKKLRHAAWTSYL